MQTETTTEKGLFQQVIEAIRDGKVIIWEDPGHGWLQVPLAIVERAQKERGLKVSDYSYKDHENAYLEEDCDMTAFCDCFKEVNWRVQFQQGQIRNQYRDNIFIRRLGHFE